MNDLAKTSSTTTREAAQLHYLTTGEHDSLFRGWPGDNMFDAARKVDAGLRSVLISEVRSRGAHATLTPALQAIDVVALTRSKAAPMVTGVFPRHEQAAVLAMLERSVVFLVPENIESVLRSMPWLHTAWSLANLYLASAGPALLSPEDSPIVGLSHQTTCYVSVDYFRDSDPFADYLVHEAAHIFHNCKRATVGLPETGRRQFLLDIDFGMREAFDYACEAYSAPPRALPIPRGPLNRSGELHVATEGRRSVTSCESGHRVSRLLPMARQVRRTEVQSCRRGGAPGRRRS